MQSSFSPGGSTRLVVATSIAIPGPLKGARFVDRPNRFVVRAALEPEETVVSARLFDPGDHGALLQPNHRVWLRPAHGPNGEVAWSLVLAQNGGGTLVSLVPQLVLSLVHTAIAEESIPELEGWFVERTDVPIGRSRVPFQLSTYAGEKMLISVVSATRVDKGIALFPDGPNEQGARVLRELANVPERPGWHATALFVAPRNDATSISPNEVADPETADAIRAAENAGVRLLGRRCQLTLQEAMMGVALPVDPWDMPL